MRAAIGELLNHLHRTNVVTTASTQIHASAASTGHGVKFLHDGLPANYFQFRYFGELYSRITVDLQLVKNGLFASMSGWKAVYAGLAPARDVNMSAPGGADMNFYWDETDDKHFGVQEIVCRSGELLKFKCSLVGSGDTPGTGRFAIQDKYTGRWLKTDGTWSETESYIGVCPVSSDWADKVDVSKQFQCEPFSKTLQHLTTIRLIGMCSGRGSGSVADVQLYPATDFCSLHGVAPIIGSLVPSLWGGDTIPLYNEDSGAVTGAVQLVTMTPARPSFFGLVALPVYYRYVWLDLTGTPITAPWIGELIVGQSVAFTPTGRYGVQLDFSWGTQNAKASRAVRLKTKVQPARTLTIQFRWGSDAAYRTFLEWFALRVRGPAEDFWVSVPGMDSDVALFGGGPGTFGHQKIAPNIRDSVTIKITEDAGPRL